MSNENMLFILTTCPSCNMFIETCQRLNILSKFKIIRVDGRVSEFVSKGIQTVPSIYISGMTNLIIGKECHKWISSIEQSMSVDNPTLRYAQNLNGELNNPNHSNNNVKKPPQIKTAEKNNEKKLLGFLQNEMTGISDNYAYKEDDNAFPMSFQSKNYNFEIKTVPEKNKVSVSATKGLIKNAELMRDSDRLDFMKKFDEDYEKYTNKGEQNPYFYAT